MKQIHDDNAIRGFDAIYKDNSPAMIEKLEDTAKDILTQDSWITQHIKQIASNAVGYQKDNLQKYIDKTINSDSSRQVINTLAKSAVDHWTPIIGDEKPIDINDTKQPNKYKKENHHPKFGVAFDQIEKEDLRATKLKIENTSKKLKKSNRRI